MCKDSVWATKMLFKFTFTVAPCQYVCLPQHSSVNTPSGPNSKGYGTEATVDLVTTASEPNPLFYSVNKKNNINIIKA